MARVTEFGARAFMVFVDVDSDVRIGSTWAYVLPSVGSAVSFRGFDRKMRDADVVRLRHSYYENDEEVHAVYVERVRAFCG